LRCIMWVLFGSMDLLGKDVGVMRIAITKPLFAWDCLEDNPSLRTVREFLGSVPDERLLRELALHRGKGRNEYPVRVLWGTLLLTIVLRHPSIESCLGDLHRNEGLRLLLGIEQEAGIPKKWNMSRFLNRLGGERFLPLVHEVFNRMVGRLAEEVKDLGKHTAGDSAHLSGRASRGGSRKFSGGLAGPSGGRKEYVREDGTVDHVVEWFGYKFHLLVDVKHEVVVSHRETTASVADCTVLPELVSEARGNLGEGRMETVAYDKAADTEPVHEVLGASGIAPVIQNRCLWEGEHERMLPGHDGTSNVVYDESGTVYCYDKTSSPPVRHQMSYAGHEKSRGTLKYRCPAMVERWSCPHRRVCNKGRKFGKTVRVAREIDARRFPPIPRATKKFERLYRGRTAVERVNARCKVFWGADDGNIAGPERFHAYMEAVLIVHIGLATLLARAPRWEGTLSRTRLTPIAHALHGKRGA